MSEDREHPGVIIGRIRFIYTGNHSWKLNTHYMVLFNRCITNIQTFLGFISPSNTVMDDSSGSYNAL